MRGLTVTFALCLALAGGAVHAQVAKTAADGFCKSITHCGGAEKDVTCVCHSGCTNHNGTAIAQCQSSADCAQDRTCVGQRCVDPCAGQCGQNTECHVANHAHYCKCTKGFTGDPKAGCIQAEAKKCRLHKHCPEDKACVDNICIDPCEFANCGYGSVCKIVNHEITCISTPEYSSLSFVGCKSHEDCDSQSVCVVNKCVNPCNFGVCAPGEECSASNHEVFCLSAYHSPANAGPTPCEHDNDCEDDERCNKDEGECEDPCYEDELCQLGSLECVVTDHSMTCTDPIKVGECQSDGDCSPNKKCDGDSYKCVDPCLDPDTCGVDAVCEVKNHATKCTPKEDVNDRCKQDEDCPATKQCDGKKCYDPCEKDVCRAGVPCTVVNHAAVCLDKDKVKVECSKDSECPEDKACRSDKCIDPCTTSKCEEGAVCEVRVHEPVCKSILDPIPPNCTSSKDCPPDRVCDGLWCIDTCGCKPCGVENTCSIVDNKVSCTRITPEGECKTNDDCPADKTCNGLACVDPCSLSKELCKEHQQCKIENHKPVCENKPDKECSNMVDCADDKTFVRWKCVDPCRTNACGSTKECSNVVDCADDKTCVRWKCVDPCRNNACGSTSNCKASSHTAICTPKPNEKVNCSSSSDCVSDRVCLQGYCEDPCSKFCKGGASCTVVDHVYSCGGRGGNIKSGNCSGTLFPTTVGRKRYYTITDLKINWWGAFMWCAAHGKQLATIENKEENEQILKVIEETKIRNGRFYVGGTDAGFEKHWMWMPTGLPIVKFNYWHNYRPSNAYYYDCLMYWESPGSPGYRWYDDLCTYKNTHHFICQDYRK